MAGRRFIDVGQRHLDASRDLRLRAAAAPPDAPHDGHWHGPLLARLPEMFSEMRRAAMTPVWIAQLATGTKSFERNAVIGSRRLNEWGLHAGRVALAYRLAQARRRKLASLVSEEDRKAFDRDGFVVRPNFLPPEQFAALVAQARAYLGPLREIAEGDTIMRKIALDGRALAALPAPGAVLQSREWRGLVRHPRRPPPPPRGPVRR